MPVKMPLVIESIGDTIDIIPILMLSFVTTVDRLSVQLKNARHFVFCHYTSKWTDNHCSPESKNNAKFKLNQTFDSIAQIQTRSIEAQAYPTDGCDVLVP
jgi:hypothetical protein